MGNVFLVLALHNSAFSFLLLYPRLPKTSYLKMIDIWFVALMLIPSVEVIVHVFGYLSRTKFRVYPSKQTQIDTKFKGKLQIGTRVQQNLSLAPGFGGELPSKECWNEALKSKGIGHCLKKSTTACNIILPVFFVIFLVTFISIGILLKHNLI